RNKGKRLMGRTVRTGRTIKPARMATTVRLTASRCTAGAGDTAGRATIPCPMRATHRCRPADPRAKIDRVPGLGPGIAFKIYADQKEERMRAATGRPALIARAAPWPAAPGTRSA